MKAFLRLLLVAVVAAMVVSCGGPSKKNENALELWHGFNAEETVLFRQIVTEFEEDWKQRKGTSIAVDVKYVSYNDMETKLRTATMSRIAPDVAFLDSIKVTDFAFGRALTPIDELDEFKARYGTIDKGREEFVASSYDAGLVNRVGKVNLYALPVQTTTVALFWNRELFRRNADGLRAAGLDPNRPPRDWDEMAAYGKILTNEKDGVYALGLSGSLWFNFTIFNMYGLEFVKYDEKGHALPALDNANGRLALARLNTLANSGYEGGAWKRSALGPEAGFINRKYAMVMTGPWNVESFKNAGLDFDVSLIPAPTRAEVDELGLRPRNADDEARLGILAYSSSNVGGQSGVIMRHCQNVGAAYEFLEYFTSEPVQRRWASTLGQIPVRRAAWKDLDKSKFPFMGKFMDQLALAKRIPQIPRYGTLESGVYNPEVDLLLQGKQQPAAMLKNMEAGLKARILDDINAALEE